MKELWTTNPFHLMNSPFAEMGYNSSEPLIVPAHLLLATRRPSARHPLASGAASADANRALIPLCAQAVGITGVGLLVSALLTLCAPSACSPRNIRRPLCVPPADSPPSACQRTAQHPSAPCTPSARQLTARYLPTSPQTICQRTAQHLPPLHIVRRLPADNPQARAALLVPLRTNRQREPTPLVPAKTRSAQLLTALCR